MKLFVVFVLLVLAAGVVLWLSGAKLDAPEGLSQANELQVVDPSGSSAAAPPSKEPLATPQAQHERGVAGIPSQVADSTEAKTIEVNTTFRGKVFILDPSGSKLEGANGSLDLLLWKERRGEHRTTAIQNGAFELDFGDAEYMTISNVELSNEGGMIVDASQRYVPTDQPVPIYVTRSKVLYLSVLSADSGVHLSEITVVCSLGWREEGSKHPGRVTESTTVLTKGTSPLTLRPRVRDVGKGSAQYLVWSPGYAWQPIQLNLVEGGEREVRLVRGGDLEVRITGDAMKPKAKLCLYSNEETTSRPFVEVSAFGKDSIQLNSLIPGGYNASVRIGDWFDSPLILAEQPVQIVAGETAVVELVPTPPPEVLLAPLAGVLVLPEEWGIENFLLSADLERRAADGSDGEHKLVRQQLRKSSTEKDAWLFDFGSVATGEYNLELGTIGYPKEFEYGILADVELGTAGTLRLEVPPPADVFVRLVDGTTEDIATIHSIHWGPAGPARFHSRSLVDVSKKESDGAFEFRAPVGSINLGAFGGEYTSLHEEVEIHPGRNDFQFTVNRNCPLVILFMDGETPVPPSGHFYPSPEHLGGEGKLLFTTSGSSGFKTALSEPGSYVFPASEFPSFTGFEPIPDQTITVVRGKETTHTIRLVRSE